MSTETAVASGHLFDFVSKHEGLHRKKPGDQRISSYCDPASPMGKALQVAGLWNAYLYRGYDPGEKYTTLSGAPWTIGYGSTGADIGPNTVWTLEQVKFRYQVQSATFMEQVASAVKVPVSPMQLAMLTSLAYNIGIAAFRSSTLLRLLNAGDYVGAADQFLRWNKAQGKVMPGLETRRAAERGNFLASMCREPEA
jgi:lysozyme